MTTTATEAPTTADQLTKFAYVLTLQFSLGGMNHYVAESSGVIEVPQGYSRHSAFQEIRQRMTTQAHQQGRQKIYGEPTTIFFSIERDSL